MVKRAILSNNDSQSEKSKISSLVNQDVKALEKNDNKAKCRITDGAIGSVDDTAAQANEAPVFVGIDTEWCPHPRRRKRENVVLTYGLSVVCGGKSHSIVIEPKGPDRRQRLSLGHLVGRALQAALANGVLPAMPKRIILAVHFGRGDLTACRDFPNLKPQLAAVRGTLPHRQRPTRIRRDA